MAVVFNNMKCYLSKDVAEMTHYTRTEVATLRKRNKLEQGKHFFQLTPAEAELFRENCPEGYTPNQFVSGTYLYTEAGVAALTGKQDKQESTMLEVVQPETTNIVDIPKPTFNVHDLQVVEYNGERVLTTEQLAGGYDCEPSNIKKNFNDNKERFIEGKHYFKLEGEDLRDFKNRVTNSDLVGKNANILYLWTKRGAARHSKMVGTDRAWDIFDALEENYFADTTTKTMSPNELIAAMANQNVEQERRQRELERRQQELETKQDAQAKEIASMKVILTLRPENWREDSRKIVNHIATKRGNGKDDYQNVWNEIYTVLEARFHVSLGQRKKNRQKRMAEAGTSKTAIKSLTKLDIIADDPKLIEGVISIIKEFAIKEGITVTADHNVIEFKVVED